MTAQETIQAMKNNGYSKEEMIHQAESIVNLSIEFNINLINDWKGVLNILKPKKLENITKVTK